MKRMIFFKLMISAPSKTRNSIFAHFFLNDGSIDLLREYARHQVCAVPQIYTYGRCDCILCRLADSSVNPANKHFKLLNGCMRFSNMKVFVQILQILFKIWDNKQIQRPSKKLSIYLKNEIENVFNITIRMWQKKEKKNIVRARQLYRLFFSRWIYRMKKRE